jgi:hypothetical protein
LSDNFARFAERVPSGGGPVGDLDGEHDHVVAQRALGVRAQGRRIAGGEA